MNNTKISDALYNCLATGCSEHDLALYKRDENRFDVCDKFQRDFYLIFEQHQSGIVASYFVFRTDSFSYNGERTDLHDVESLLFSLSSLLNGFSVSLWDVGNGFSDIEEELYGRFATVVQPNLSVLTDDEQGVEKAISLLLIYKKFQCLLLDYLNQSHPQKRYNWDVFCLHSLRKRIANVIGIESDHVVGCERSKPDWFYFQIYSLNISIFSSKIAKKILSSSLDSYFNGLESIEDNGTTYYKAGSNNNSFSLEDIEQIKSISKELSSDEVKLVVTENNIFAITDHWFITKSGSFGIDRFLEEREIFTKSVDSKGASRC